MSDFSAENLEHDHIVDLVRAFSKDADDKGKCNGFTSMWLQAVLTGKKQEQDYYERLNRLSRFLPGKNICLMETLPENPLENPESVKGNIYLTKEGDYVVYTQALDGSGWVERKGTLFEFIKPDNEEFKKMISELDNKYSDGFYREFMSLVVNKIFIKKIAQEVDKIFQSKVYNLFLMTDEISNGELPAENAIYVEQNGNKLKYIVLDRNDKSKSISGLLDIDIGTEELTTEKLEKLRSEILRKTSLVGHTRSAEENQLTEAQKNVVDMRAFAENVLIQQNPDQTKIFDTYVSQDDKSVLSLLTQSIAQGEKSIIPAELGVFIGGMKDLENYFTEIESTLAKREVVEGGERVTYLLGSDNHAVGVYFDDESKKWHFMDVNQLSGKKTYYADVNSAELADHLFDSYSDDKKANTTFSITRLSMNPKNENDLINEKVKTLSKNILTKKHSFFLPDKTNSRGSNAMILASGAGQKEMVDALIKNSASVNKKNNEGITPLRMAVQNGHIQVVNALFKAGAKENKSKTSDGTTLLIMAAQNGHEKIVKLLADRKNDLNEKDNIGMTAIMAAVLSKQYQMVDLLCNLGANIDERNEKGQTALIMAAGKNDIQMVTLLLRKGANLSIKDLSGGSAFLYAIKNKNPDMVNLFLNHDPNIIKITGPGGGSIFPLAAALISPETKFYDMTLDQKASFSILETLFEKESDPENRKAALGVLKEIFAMTNYADLLTDLISYGYTNIAKAIIEVSEINTISPMDLVLCAVKDNTILKELLLKDKEKLKDLNSSSFAGYPILTHYVKSNDLKAVKVLLEAGIDLKRTVVDSRRIKDKNEVGKTAMDIAVEMAKDPNNDMTEIIEILSKALENTQSVAPRSPVVKPAIIFSPPKDDAPEDIKTIEPTTPTVKTAVIFSQNIAAPDDLKSAASQSLSPLSPKSSGSKPSAGFTPLSQSKIQEQAPAKSAEAPAEPASNQPEPTKKTPTGPSSQG